MKNKTLRITSIPRTSSPGAAYHPMFFAKKFNDKVLAIPGRGEPIESKYLSLSEKFLKNFPLNFPLKLKKILFLLELILISFLCMRNKNINVFVHSFLYSIPFILIGKQTTLVIHGSDHVKLDGFFGKLLIKYLKNVYVVGKKKIAGKYGIKSIPNIFNMGQYTVIKDGYKRREFDFCFILRNAKVKNPKFPEKLYKTISKEHNIKIIVIGIIGEDKVEGKKSIEYTGVKSPGEVHNILANTKVFVLPSFEEGISKAMFEALSNGCSVIVNEGVELPEEISGIVKKFDCNEEIDISLFLKLILENKIFENQNVAKDYLQHSENFLSNLYKKRG